jgi:hypothetical protein
VPEHGAVQRPPERQLHLVHPEPQQVDLGTGLDVRDARRALPPPARLLLRALRPGDPLHLPWSTSKRRLPTSTVTRPPPPRGPRPSPRFPGCARSPGAATAVSEAPAPVGRTAPLPAFPPATHPIGPASACCVRAARSTRRASPPAPAGLELASSASRSSGWRAPPRPGPQRYRRASSRARVSALRSRSASSRARLRPSSRRPRPRPARGRLVHRLRERLLLFLQGSQKRFDLEFARVDVSFGPVQHVGGKPQPPGDGQAVAPPRRPFRKRYVGSIRSGIEEKRRVDDAAPGVSRRFMAPRWEVTTDRARGPPASRAWPGPGLHPRPGRCRSPSRPSGRGCRAPPRRGSRARARWAEKVDRDSAMDCSSPMSAKTSRSTGRREPGPTGGRMPVWASRGRKPHGLQEDGLPPVLGPEITSARSSGPSSSEKGITGGWSGSRAPSRGGGDAGPSTMEIPRARLLVGRQQLGEVGVPPGGGERPGPERVELGPGRRGSWPARREAGGGAPWSLSGSGEPPRSSSRSSSWISFMSSRARGGSTKRVAPVADSPWITPPTSDFPSRRSWITYRPSRTDTEASGTRIRSGARPRTPRAGGRSGCAPTWIRGGAAGAPGSRRRGSPRRRPRWR